MEIRLSREFLANAWAVVWSSAVGMEVIAVFKREQDAIDYVKQRYTDVVTYIIKVIP